MQALKKGRMPKDKQLNYIRTKNKELLYFSNFLSSTNLLWSLQYLLCQLSAKAVVSTDNLWVFVSHHLQEPTFFQPTGTRIFYIFWQIPIFLSFLIRSLNIHPILSPCTPFSFQLCIRCLTFQSIRCRSSHWSLSRPCIPNRWCSCLQGSTLSGACSAS